eukprot:gene34028-biopygen4774
MRYEQLVLAPALLYMHDAIVNSEGTMDLLMDEKKHPTLEELGEHVYTAHSTFKGRVPAKTLRASMEPAATVHGGSEALRAKLAFIEEKVYAGSDGLVTNSVFTKWLKEFDIQKAKAVMNTHAKAFHDRQGGKGKGGAVRGAGKGDGGRSGGKDGRGIEALRALELASRVILVRPGLERSEKKGHWEPTHLVEHLRLEVDLKAGQFRVTLARLQKIQLQAKALLNETSRQERWLPTRKLAAFAGLYQSVYLAVPPARLYLRVLHFVIFTKRGWGAKAVVAMLSHFTLRNPELMRHMRRLWILLDLYGIELQARDIRSEANDWADRVSRDRDLDDWRLKRRWFQWAERDWHWHMVDRFASALSAQWVTGADGLTRVAYDDGGQEDLDMSKEKNEVVPAAVREVSGWDAVLQERWRGELGDTSLTELTVQMQEATLGGKVVGNYRPKAQALMQFCVAEGRVAAGHGGHAGLRGLVQLLQHWEQVQDASWVRCSAEGSEGQSSYWGLLWEQGKLRFGCKQDCGVAESKSVIINMQVDFQKMANAYGLSGKALQKLRESRANNRAARNCDEGCSRVDNRAARNCD